MTESAAEKEATALRWWADVVASLVRDEVLTPEEAERATLAFSEDASLRGTPRNFAATYVGLAGQPWGPVEVHRDLLQKSSRKLIAVLLHELGHVLDGTGRHREDDDPEDGETRADLLVERVLGVELRYDPKDMVQTLGSGILRPAGLK